MMIIIESFYDLNILFICIQFIVLNFLGKIEVLS